MKVKKVETVEREFSRSDFILSVSQRWETSFRWLLENNLIHSEAVCPTCNRPMELSPLGSGLKRDMRMFRCRDCLTRESIRYNSFLAKLPFTVQEFVRVTFYYFAKGFEAELTHREMTENTIEGGFI